MNIDCFGIPSFCEKDLKNILHSADFEKIFSVLCKDSEEIQKFNQAANILNKPNLSIYEKPNISVQEFDDIIQSNWMMPKEFYNINVKEYLLNKTTTDIEKLRVLDEYKEYESRNLIDLLKYLIFLIDFMRKENIIWGVGRGSSVSSYILYLIGVHRINSIKYELDYKEFFGN